MSPRSGIFQPDLLAGKVALVTGGGTGIGLGIATALGSAGADSSDRQPQAGAPGTGGRPVARLRRQGDGCRSQCARARGGGPHGPAGIAAARETGHSGQQRGGEFLCPQRYAVAQWLAGGGGDRPLRDVLLLPGGVPADESPGRRSDRFHLHDPPLSGLAPDGARHRSEGRR